MTLHCTSCGAAFTSEGWPRTCEACGKTTWKNPTPVAVLLQPSTTGELLVIRRGIEPRKGHLALPGGYVDWEESWQAACARELAEETGVQIEAAGVELFDVLSPPDGRTVLIFGVAPPIAKEGLVEFEASPETSERTWIGGPQEMAFPLHTQVVEAFFTR